MKTLLSQLWDPQRSPMPHLPRVVRTVWRAAPAEAAVNLTGMLLQGLWPAVVTFLLQQVIDAVAAGNAATSLTDSLIAIAVVLVVAELSGAVYPVTNNRILTKVTPAVQEFVLAKAAQLSLAQFDRPDVHDVIERAGNGHGGRIATVWLRMTALGWNGLRTLASVVLLTMVSPAVAAVAALVVGPIAWAGARQGRRMYELYGQQTSARRQANYIAGLLGDRLAATEVRAYQLVSYFTERWRTLFARQRDERLEAHWKSTLEGWGADLAVVALFAGAMSMVTSLGMEAAVTAGAIVTLARSVNMLYESARMCAITASELWQAALPLADLERFLDLPEEERQADQGQPFPQPIRAGIRFESVSFRYPGQEHLVLENLSFEIRAGEKVALVGNNGAGKSTLIKLMLGLYQPTSGRITVDGVNMAAIAPDSLRGSMSCAFQDFARFDMTVADNVRFGRLGSDGSDVEAAIDGAGLRSFVESLPQGVDTMLGKSFTGGGDLSGGQWQRIALARAFIRNAQVVVLDEPTAALDARAELDLFDKFVTLMKGRTAVLISHRLGAARLADRIILLDGGRIAEMGSHDELIAREGMYARLFRTQAHWYEDQPAPAMAGEVAV